MLWYNSAQGFGSNAGILHNLVVREEPAPDPVQGESIVWVWICTMASDLLEYFTDYKDSVKLYRRLGIYVYI